MVDAGKEMKENTYYHPTAGSVSQEKSLILLGLFYPAAPLQQRVFNMRLLDLKNLEAAGHQRLEDTRGIVLGSCFLEEPHILGPVALERVLVLERVIEVDELVVLADTLGVRRELGHERLAGLMEELVLLDSVPGEVELVHCKMVLSS